MESIVCLPRTMSILESNLCDHRDSTECHRMLPSIMPPFILQATKSFQIVVDCLMPPTGSTVSFVVGSTYAGSWHANCGENASLNVAGTCRSGVIDQLDSPMWVRDRIMTHLTKQLLNVCNVEGDVTVSCVRHSLVHNKHKNDEMSANSSMTGKVKR